MKKYYYYVVDVKNEKKGWLYAQALRVASNNNLWSYLNDYAAGLGTISFVHQCETWKKAKEVEEYWNECHRNNGCSIWNYDD